MRQQDRLQRAKAIIAESDKLTRYEKFLITAMVFCVVAMGVIAAFWRYTEQPMVNAVAMTTTLAAYDERPTSSCALQGRADGVGQICSGLTSSI